MPEPQSPQGHARVAPRPTLAQFVVVVAAAPLLGLLNDLTPLPSLVDVPEVAIGPRLVARALLSTAAASCLLFAPRLRTPRRRVLLMWYGVGLFLAALFALGPGGVLRNVLIPAAQVGVGVMALGGAVIFTRWLRPSLSDLWQESDRT